VQEIPEMLQYFLDHAADAIVELGCSQSGRDTGAQVGFGRQGGRGRCASEGAEAELAKCAPLDKIQRLPAELVPEHIRHFVPTVAPLSL